MVEFPDLISGSCQVKATCQQQHKTNFKASRVLTSHFFKAQWDDVVPCLYRTGDKKKQKTTIRARYQRLVSVCPNHCPYHSKLQSPASEEPVDQLSLRVQVDVVETRPGGQTRDGGHLTTATESGVNKTLYKVHSGHS